MVSPTGGYVTPQIRDAILRSGQRELQQEAGQEMRAGQYDVNRLNQARQMQLAGLTRPILTQTQQGYTGKGTVQQSQSPWATVAQVGGMAAPFSL